MVNERGRREFRRLVEVVYILSEKVLPVVAWETMVEEVREGYRSECHGLVRGQEGKTVAPQQCGDCLKFIVKNA